jgi:chromosomal replication initiation ATPase DnaA
VVWDQFNFDDFIVGSSNSAAFAAAKSFSESLKPSPLTILSPSPGNGATHLSAALYNEFRRLERTAIMASAEQLSLRLNDAVNKIDSSLNLLVIDGFGYWKSEGCHQLDDLISILTKPNALVLSGQDTDGLPKLLRNLISRGQVVTIDKPSHAIRHEFYRRNQLGLETVAEIERYKLRSMREIIGLTNRHHCIGLAIDKLSRL